MKRPRICAVIVDGDLAVVRQAEELADLLEVRIDLVGDGWPGLAAQLRRPWLASNRAAAEGGCWLGSEEERIGQLLRAVELGAAAVDIELGAESLARVVPRVKGRAECLISFHDFAGTPPFSRLREIVRRQMAAGADICKVVTTAQRFEDNITVLRLIAEFPEARVVSFAMGSPGAVSRVLCPLLGGDFTYAATGEGRESAPGQMTVAGLRKLYEMVTEC